MTDLVLDLVQHSPLRLCPNSTDVEQSFESMQQHFVTRPATQVVGVGASCHIASKRKNSANTPSLTALVMLVSVPPHTRK
eukprot:5564592-Amphidinium_carterae.2